MLDSTSLNNGNSATGQATCPGSIKNTSETMNLETGSPVIVSLHSVTNAPSEYKAVSIENFSCEDLASQDVNLTKQEVKIHTYEPQMGIEDVMKIRQYLDSIKLISNVDISEIVLKEIEDIILRLYVATQCNDFKGILALIVNYVQNHMDKSMSTTILNYINELIYCDEAQSGEEDDVKGEDIKFIEPNWLSAIKLARDNWNNFKNNGLFDNVCKILGLLTVTGLAQASSLTFSLADFKILEPKILSTSSSAGDILSAISDVAIYFCERVVQCWKTRSLRPMMNINLNQAELDVRYSEAVVNWDLQVAGNLHKVKGINDHEFFFELESLCTKFKSMLPTLKGIEKRLIDDKYRTILRYIAEFQTKKVNSGFKRSPFCIEYAGDSKVGKSTISNQVVHYLFTGCGLSTDDDRKYVHVTGAKHWDGAKSSMLELILDDHGNTKSEYVESSPCEVLIKTKNNVPFAPPMADLASKGTVFVQPEMITITTNDITLGAFEYSNCPYTVQRRADFVLYVRPKNSFIEVEDDVMIGLDTKAVRKFYTYDGVYDPPPYEDVWVVDILRAMPGKSLKEVGPYKFAKDDDGVIMKGVSNVAACNFLAKKFNKFRNEQIELEERILNKGNQVKCPVDGCPQVFGYCLDHPVDLDVQSGYVCRDVSQNYDCTKILDDAKGFYDRFDWVPYLPISILNSPYFRYIMLSRNLSTMQERFATEVKVILVAFVISNVMFHSLLWLSPFFFMVSLLLCLFYCFLLVVILKDLYFVELRNRAIVKPIDEEFRNKALKTFLSANVVVGGIYALSLAYKAYRKMYPQGSLEPKTIDEIEERDNETSPWTSVIRRPLPISHRSKTMNVEKLVNAVSKNLFYCTITLKDICARADILMLTSNVAMLPNHYFDEYGYDLKCTFRRENPETSGCKFATILSRSASVLIPDTDMRLCYTPVGGSFKNIVDYFPIDYLPDSPFRMIWRNKEGNILNAKGYGIKGRPKTVCEFEGGHYQSLTMNTFGGLCGAVLCSDAKGSAIMGLHLGGRSGTPLGCYGSFLQSQLKDAINELRSIEGVIVSGSAGAFDTTMMGKTIVEAEDPHKKSPVNYLPHSSQFEYLGTCPGRAQFKSDAKNTLMSKHVEEVFHSPNIYMGPIEKPSWRGFSECLGNMANPGKSIPHHLLKKSILDYKSTLTPIFQSELWNKTTPMDDRSNINGCPREKFLDAIKSNTSVGFPLTGPKINYMIELESEDGFLNRTFDPIIFDEINRCDTLYASGKRAYPIAKACKKDEILSKEKVRVMYSNSVAATFNIRKYFLPILRILQMNPLQSECAVGINAYGPEWSQLYKYVTRFGEDRVFGGDYGKYDQKLPAQLLFASLRILIDFARECDYSEEDLMKMEALTGDIVYAYIAFDGNLIGLTEGGHISGNSLTVIINGICGALNLRNYFFTQYPPHDGVTLNFRDCVALSTYGDDNIGSVRADIDKFTIKGCSKFLGELGQIYTMPDKTSELKDFLDPSEWEFLKRQSVYNEDLGLHLGALSIKSIMKPLHMVLRPKGSPLTDEMVCAENLDGAAMEFWLHGKEIYEDAREKLQEVARRSDVSHMCKRLHYSYEDILSEWKVKYLGDKEILPQNERHYDIQCGEEIPFSNDRHCIQSSDYIQFWWEFPLIYLSPFLVGALHSFQYNNKLKICWDKLLDVRPGWFIFIYIFHPTLLKFKGTPLVFVHFVLLNYCDVHKYTLCQYLYNKLTLWVGQKRGFFYDNYRKLFFKKLKWGPIWYIPSFKKKRPKYVRVARHIHKNRNLKGRIVTNLRTEYVAPETLNLGQFQN